MSNSLYRAREGKRVKMAWVVAENLGKGWCCWCWWRWRWKGCPRKRGKEQMVWCLFFQWSVVKLKVEGAVDDTCLRDRSTCFGHAGTHSHLCRFNQP